ncbi:alcohol dehydrogenase catalytic domain-containing protein [Streptomyces sp. NPDC088251]|uniref:alcohol dehydrogenase catalytic domain-containing protein n=1 Tax=Streptomyces sp. NPDC088251 TaxID=3365844 RepID=UPI003816BCC8
MPPVRARSSYASLPQVCATPTPAPAAATCRSRCRACSVTRAPGIVEAVGPGVTSPAVGDHVVLGWPFCGECKHCREGEPRYCLSIAPALVPGVRFTGESAGTSGYRRAQVEDQVRNTEAPPRRFGRKGGASVSGLDHPHPDLDAGWLS